MRLIKKVGIFVYGLEMLNHLKGIILNMPPEATCVVTEWDETADSAQVAAFATSQGFETISARKAYESGIRFEVLLSHHPIIVPSEEIFQALAVTHVRIMYALGKANWNFSSWNQLYETVLCWGPYHAKMLAERFPKIRLEQVGYPRFDPYFTGAWEKEKILSSLACDPAKPVVVWLPTWAALSSIRDFSESISTLKSTVNLLVKPHPLTFADPKAVEPLEKFDIPVIKDLYYDNVQLFYVADYVLADYGGSPCGAIYTGKKLLLLNVKGAGQHQHTGEDSLDIRLRDWVVNIDPEQGSEIGKIIADESIWDAQLARYEQVRTELFAPKYGFSSLTAAHALVNMLVAKLVSQQDRS